MWHVRAGAQLSTPDLDAVTPYALRSGRLIDVSWGIIVCDRVSPRGTMHILDHVPQLRVATY
jgi:hypothetical protein